MEWSLPGRQMGSRRHRTALQSGNFPWRDPGFQGQGRLVPPEPGGDVAPAPWAGLDNLPVLCRQLLEPAGWEQSDTLCVCGHLEGWKMGIQARTGVACWERGVADLESSMGWVIRNVVGKSTRGVVLVWSWRMWSIVPECTWPGAPGRLLGGGWRGENCRLNHLNYHWNPHLKLCCVFLVRFFPSVYFVLVFCCFFSLQKKLHWITMGYSQQCKISIP